MLQKWFKIKTFIFLIHLQLADFRQIWILEHMTANIYGQVAIIHMRWGNPGWVGHTKKYNPTPYHDGNRKKTCWWSWFGDFISTNYYKCDLNAFHWHLLPDYCYSACWNHRYVESRMHTMSGCTINCVKNFKLYLNIFKNWKWYNQQTHFSLF